MKHFITLGILVLVAITNINTYYQTKNSITGGLEHDIVIEKESENQFIIKEPGDYVLIVDKKGLNDILERL